MVMAFHPTRFGVNALDDPQNDASEFSDLDPERLADSEAKSKLLRAMFTNRIFVQPDGLHLRMTFGERVGTEDLFHTSIVVPNGDALMFGKLIVDMAEKSLNRMASGDVPDGE